MGCPIKQTAMHNFLLLPPLSFQNFLSKVSISRLSARYSDSYKMSCIPTRYPNTFRIYFPVSISHRVSSWQHTPEFQNIFVQGRWRMCSRYSCPEVGGTRLVRILNVVDLPAPLGPSKPRIQDELTYKDRERRASYCP